MDCIFLSEYLDLNSELNELGVFDSIINKDSHFFINLLRLKKAKTPEFLTSYKTINEYFEKIMLLLENSKQKDDKLYKAALNKFVFSEVNGINLGFSETNVGAGFGKKLSKQVMSDAFDIVKAGSKQPEIFQLVGLFEENVAADRLSDMIATLILPDIRRYTIRINKELGITQEKYTSLEIKNGIVINPYKQCELLYLPEEILHELPIAKCWDDIDKVILENQIIRNEINELVGDTWKKLACSDKKAYLKNYIFKDPEKCQRVIEGYCNEEIGVYSKTSDIDYFIADVFRQIKKSGLLDFLQHSNNKEIDSMNVAFMVLDTFKDWVENNKGWEQILASPKQQREKSVQKLIQLSGKYICKSHDYDFTFEANEGPGPADIKISRGDKDKTVIEVKLNSNPNYIHGYEEQINLYSKAEDTRKSIYAYIKVEDHPICDKRMVETYQRHKQEDVNAPELYVIDSQEKVSASKVR